MSRRQKSNTKIRSISTPDLQPGDPVWACLRHSPGDDQDIRAQRRTVEEWCAERDLVITRWWIDEAKTGAHIAGRDQFEAMIAASREQPPPVRAIIIRDWARFARDDLEAQFYSADLRLRGYAIVSIFDNVPAGEFQGIFESFIRWKNWRYLVDLQANVMKGLDNAVFSEVMVDGVRRRGFSGGGFAPVGYEARTVQIGLKPSGKPQTLTYWVQTNDPDLRRRVALAWEMAVQAARCGEKPPVSEIHRLCHLHGHLSSYYDWFRSPTFRGTRKVGERIVEGAHDAYVSEEDWEMVQRCLPDGKLSPSDAHPKRVNSQFLLSGKVFCGYCGGRIDYERENRRATFATLRCSTRKKNAAACRLMKLSYATFMDGVLELLRTKVLTEDCFREAIDQLNNSLNRSTGDTAEQCRQLVKEIAGLSRSIAHLLDALEAGTPTSSVRERLLEREREKTLKEAELAGLTSNQRRNKPIKVSATALRGLVERLRQDLDSGSEEKLRAILAILIVRIEVTNEAGRVDYTIPIDAFLPDPGPDKGGYEWYARRDSNPRHLVPKTSALIR